MEKGGEEGKVPVKFQRAAFVRHQASEGVIRRPFDTGYGCGCGKKRMTGSGNGAPCYWETRLVNEAGDLDLRVSLFPGHKGTILPRFPWAASQFIPLAPTSGLFNPTTGIVPPSAVFAMYHPFPPQNDDAPYSHQDPFQPSTSQQGKDPSSQSPLRPIGAPLHFTTGQFTGKHVRAELIELQKADLGRKYVRHSCYSHTASHTYAPNSFRYARKDRRPLDPPPVVQLKFFYSFPGTDRPDAEVDNYELRVLSPCFFILAR